MEEVSTVAAALHRAFSPAKINYELLGNMVPHMHWHIVPRWEGDTNFMPILTDVRVISQSLDALFDLLSAALAPS